MACNTAQFIINAAKFTVPYLSPKQRKALRVYALAKGLQNNGGTSYFASAAEWRALWAATNVIFGGATKEQTEAARLSVLASFGNIITAGPTTAPTDADMRTALSVSAPANQESELLLDQAEVLLMCNVLALVGA